MKKLLALVLALVMTMGLATVATNAAFPDASDISLTEAADVMTAVGVFQGNESGSFLPTANLDRQSAAKLIAYLDLGKTAAEAIPATQVFPDVPATNWAAKYIAYCKNAGYISGDANGNFLPTTELNGYSFGKMVLCVLGYDAEIEGMTGSSWSINIAKLLQSNGITDGIDGSASATLTREQAAQYCLNALKATMVEYDTKGTSISINGASIATGASKASAVATTAATETGAIADTKGQAGTLQLGEKLYSGDLKLKTENNDFGQTSKVWTYKNAEVGTYAKSADATLKNGLTYGDIYTALGSTVVDALKASGGTSTLKLYVDGLQVAAETQSTNYGTIDFAKLAKGNTKDFGYTAINTAYNNGNDTNKATDNGSITAIYAKDNSTTSAVKYDVTICVVNPYVVEVKGVTAATASKDRYVTIANIGDTTNNLETTYTTDNFAKGDILLVTAAKNTNDSNYAIQSAKVLTAGSTATVTSTRGTNGATSFVADGTTYKWSKMGKANVESSSSYDLYLDDEGYVLYADKVEETSNNYLMVIANGTYTKASAVSGTSDSNRSTVVFDDGTTKTITVSKTDGTKFSSDHQTDVTPVLGGVYKYVEQSDGTYSLTKAIYSTVGTVPDGSDASDLLDDTTVSNGGTVTKGYTKVSDSATKQNGDKTTIVGNASTKYIYRTKSGDTYKSSWTLYTGYGNTKSVNAAAISAAFKNNESTTTYADVVFVYAWTATADTSAAYDYLFLLNATPSYYSATDDADEYYEFDAIVNGEIGTVKATSGDLTLYNSGNTGGLIKSIESGASTAPTLYTVDYTDGQLAANSMTARTTSAAYTSGSTNGDQYKWNVFTKATTGGNQILKVELSDDGDLLTFTGAGTVAASATSASSNTATDSFGFSSDCKVFVMDTDGGNAAAISIDEISSGDNAYSKIVAVTQAMKEGSPTNTQRNTIIELYLVK